MEGRHGCETLETLVRTEPYRCIGDLHMPAFLVCPDACKTGRSKVAAKVLDPRGLSGL